MASVLKDEIFDKYRIGIEFRDYIASGQPANPEIFKTVTLQNLRKKHRRELENGTMDEKEIEDLADEEVKRLYSGDVTPVLAEDVMDEKVQEAAIKEKAEKGFLVFRKENGRPYIEEINIKSCLKEALFAISLKRAQKNKSGDTTGISKHAIQAGVFVKPEKLFLDGEIEIHERMMIVNRRAPGGIPIRVGDYKKFEVIQKPKVEFEIWVSAWELNENAIRSLLKQSEENGLGQMRKMGYGKFDVTKFAKL